ncbi:hypothetical protein [Burkholderia ubonensis]|uniref:hypothetical protein n=1 Tax=Burkholderia ubonensis TaxID=101571 RepID=UPI0009B34135|nr:hypothetical protein [Burkholderia ubonensis]
MVYVGAISEDVSKTQDKVICDMRKMNRNLAKDAKFDQMQLNNRQIATELINAVNQATQSGISVVDKGMSVVARATNR